MLRDWKIFVLFYLERLRLSYYYKYVVFYEFIYKFIIRYFCYIKFIFKVCVRERVNFYIKGFYLEDGNYVFYI